MVGRGRGSVGGVRRQLAELVSAEKERGYSEGPSTSVWVDSEGVEW